MAYATINFKNPNTGAMKQAPVGFSWTTFFFSFFPALLRGHIVGALIIFAVAFLTGGIGVLVFAFIYNKMYIKHLVGEGYKVANASMELDYLAQKLGVPLESAEG